MSNNASLPVDLFDPQLFAQQLTQSNPIGCCKSALANADNYLHAQFRDGANTGDLIRLRAAFMDALLGTMWDQQDWQGSELALVAVGGYGRGDSECGLCA